MNINRFSYKVPVTLVKFEISQQIVEEYSSVKFHDSLFGGGTDITKLIVAFRNSVKAPKPE